MDKRRIRDMRNYIAGVSISTSATRGGRNAVKGVKAAARQHVAQERVLKSLSSKSNFQNSLNTETEKLRRALPNGAQSWGLARKLINIFIRDAVYNVYPRKANKLEKIESLLEIPIDSLVGKELKNRATDVKLPRWGTIRGLTKELHGKYQNAASSLAKKEKIPRHLLDVEFWGNRDD